jgi:hypothetical protein
LLWYGKSNSLNYSKICYNYLYNSKKRLDKQLIQPRSLSKSTKRLMYFYVPFDWSFVFISPKIKSNPLKVCYLYSPIYYFKLPLSSWSSVTYFSPSTSILSLSQPLVTPLYSLYFKAMSEVFFLFSKSWFLKLKIKGKGYYIYKTFRNTITHQFGHSHRIYLYFSALSIKFLSKTSILVYGISKNDILTSGRQIRDSKPLNIFTGRGVRFSRQVIYKKTGKVSSYR